MPANCGDIVFSLTVVPDDCDWFYPISWDLPVKTGVYPGRVSPGCAVASRVDKRPELEGGYDRNDTGWD